jgi:hypothetical protein
MRDIDNQFPPPQFGLLCSHALLLCLCLCLLQTQRRVAHAKQPTRQLSGDKGETIEQVENEQVRTKPGQRKQEIALQASLWIRHFSERHNECVETRAT